MPIEMMLARIFFYLTMLVLVLILLAMLVVRPKGWLEWSTFGLILAFNMVLFRSLFLLATDEVGLPPPWGMIFWLITVLLVGNFLVAFLVEWRGIVQDVRQAYRDRRARDQE